MKYASENLHHRGCISLLANWLEVKITAATLQTIFIKMGETKTYPFLGIIFPRVLLWNKESLWTQTLDCDLFSYI